MKKCLIHVMIILKDCLEIELGSGVGYFKSIRNQIITSDIRDGFTYDMALDATDMNLKDESVKCFLLLMFFITYQNLASFFLN